MSQSDKPSDEAAAPHVTVPTVSTSLQTYFHDRLDHLRKALPEAARQLKDAGISIVNITYDGCGDSGQIDSVSYSDAQGKPANRTNRLTITDDQLMELFYDLLECRHPGWENNDGAFGEFHWDLKTDSLNHSHRERFTDYDTTEHEGL